MAQADLMVRVLGVLTTPLMYLTTVMSDIFAYTGMFGVWALCIGAAFYLLRVIGRLTGTDSGSSDTAKKSSKKGGK